MTMAKFHDIFGNVYNCDFGLERWREAFEARNKQTGRAIAT
jgi:hypothetical protein